MKGNIYLDENLTIYRGEKFFKKFLKLDYNELSRKLENFANSKENIEKFNQLYDKVMSIKYKN